MITLILLILIGAVVYTIIGFAICAYIQIRNNSGTYKNYGMEPLSVFGGVFWPVAIIVLLFMSLPWHRIPWRNPYPIFENFFRRKEERGTSKA